MYKKLLTNTVLVNLTFLLVMLFGWLSYLSMPREQDPEVNFNWVIINTAWPGATAEDVENQVTNPIEDEIKKIANISRVSSSSRENISFITVRFADMSPEQFRQRAEELRRHVQNAVDNLPPDAKQPVVVELSSSNTFPTAVVTVSGLDNDENLRKFAAKISQDLSQLKGVDRTDTWGIEDPELKVLFDPARLIGLGIPPSMLASTVKAYFRDLSAGSLRLGEQKWQVRLQGTDNDPDYLAQLPVLAIDGELPLRSVATVVRGQGKATTLISYESRPAAMISIFKRNNANNLQLVERIKHYIEEKNRLLTPFGIQIDLIDDQTSTIRNAISMMENNALIGLILVMIVTGIILGWKIALFTSLGLVFSLMGSFWILSAMGESLNIMVLLGVVIVLGMLVDDAIVVVESIYVNMRRGLPAIDAAVKTAREMWVPVLVSSLTTIAAFLPLILLPGILGQFMRVVPVVVSVALIVSLIEAFWLLPSHIISSNVNPASRSFTQRLRNRVINWIRHRYVYILIPVLRHPKISLFSGATLSVLAVVAIFSNVIKVDFFANDPIRLFYLNITLPPGSALSTTDQTLKKIETVIRQTIDNNEFHSLSTIAGVTFTETEPLFGDNLGQIMFSLPPKTPQLKSVDELIALISNHIKAIPGPQHFAFLRRKTGPPSESPISVKVRGDDIARLRQATQDLETIMATVPGIKDIHNDDTKAGMQLTVRLDPDAITRAGLDPADVANDLRLYVDGMIVADMRYEGEKWNVRVQAQSQQIQGITSFLQYPVGLPDGSEIALGQLVKHEAELAEGTIHHRNYRRTITVEADLDAKQTDTLTANRLIADKWQQIAPRYPEVSLDFSGEMDDIKESLSGMAVLFLFGLGLIYMILGTQFKSYVQPLLILATVPMAFTGVIIGLYISGNPLSLYTLYGVIALAGIAANDAIVLISTANRNLTNGMNLAHAIALAAQRRVIPILITSITTIAGLYSLAAGWGGKSLMWGPVATSIVWGLSFSTVLTLLIIPPLYAFIMRRHSLQQTFLPAPPSLPDASSGIISAFSVLRHWFDKQYQRDRKNLQEIAADSSYRAIYDMACAAYHHGEIEVAIRHFQMLAKQLPHNYTVNLMTVQSLILFMQNNGWDIGYLERAKRFFQRVHKTHPDDPRVLHLASVIQQLEQNSDIDWEQLAK